MANETEKHPAPTTYLSLLIDMKGKKTLVVGAGTIGTRRIKLLIDHGLKPLVISTSTSAEVDQWASEGKCLIIRRKFSPGDTAGCALVIAATSNARTNGHVVEEAERNGALANRIDDPDCAIQIPGIVQRGKLQIAVSTSSASPSFTRQLKRELEERFDEAYEPWIELLYQVRRRVAERIDDPARRASLLRALAQEPYLERIRRGETFDPEQVYQQLIAQE